MGPKIAIACDHAGFDLKQVIKARYESKYSFLDLGAHSTASVDYPDYAAALGKAIENGDATRGILICGSGIGMSIGVNRFGGVRAALCQNSTMARLARLHNDANVLCLGARLIGPEIAFDTIDTFLNTDFEAGRHAGRVAKLSNLC